MEFSELIRARWSPRAYVEAPVDGDALGEVFAAAPWAQSSYNEQPWRYLVATREDGDARAGLEGLLVDGNAFAKDAWLLGCSFASTGFKRNGKPNRAALHDLGAANQMIALRAFDLGLNTRFMVGFDADRARALAPDGFEPLAMFVIGRAAPDALAEGPGDRGRMPPEDIVFRGAWGESAF